MNRPYSRRYTFSTCLVSSIKLGETSTITAIEIPNILFPVNAFCKKGVNFDYLIIGTIL